MLEFLIIVFVLVVDQISKHLTETHLMLGESYPLIEGVFEFSNVHNTGAAWGMFAGGRWFFIVITVIACVLMLYLLLRMRRELGLLARICLSLLVAGAVGNLIDRVLLGYVRDMLYFSLINFPVFNVADSSVCIGAGLLVVDTLFVKTGSLFDTIEPLFEKKKGEESKTADDLDAETAISSDQSESRAESFAASDDNEERTAEEKAHDD